MYLIFASKDLDSLLTTRYSLLATHLSTRASETDIDLNCLQIMMFQVPVVFFMMIGGIIQFFAWMLK